MVFKTICVIALLTNVASALEGLKANGCILVLVITILRKLIMEYSFIFAILFSSITFT